MGREVKGSDLPVITVIVPNLNGGKTLGKALASVLDQPYPKIELIVVDGGSTDNSLDVIREYEDSLSWWVSEGDRGQSHAINKGIAKSSGEVLNWLCSDDVLLPGSLSRVGHVFMSHPEVDVLAGAGEIVFRDHRRRDYVESPSPAFLDLLPAYNGIVQQSCFWRKRILKRDPPLDEGLHYAMDVELWCHFKAGNARWEFTPDILSCFVLDVGTKTSTGGKKVARELEKVYLAYSSEKIPLTFWYRHLRYPFERLLRRDRGLLRLSVLRVIQVLYVAALIPFYGYRKVRYMSWPE